MERFVCVKDYKEKATAMMDKNGREYLNNGADDELTLRWNELAYSRYTIIPRVLRDVSNRSLKTTFLGTPVETPIGVSPTAFHCVFHPDGEFATAKAVYQSGSCYIMSSSATKTPEEVVRMVPGGLKWFQVYFSNDRDATARTVKRVAKAGFRALVLTVDVPAAGRRRCNLRQRFTLPPGVTCPLFPYDKNNAAGLGSSDIVSDLTWKDITWLKRQCGLPVIVKGILCGEDAELAIRHGADAIFVSNHGGRQLDSAPATIDVLKEVVDAVKDRVEVYMDGGVRTGTDVLKALALGARGVFVGKPAVWGLVCKGAEGVRDVLDILNAELSTAMALSGCREIADIDRTLVTKRFWTSHL